MRVFARRIDEREFGNGALILVVCIGAGDENAVHRTEEGEQDYEKESESSHCDDQQWSDLGRRLLSGFGVEWMKRMRVGRVRFYS
jgi:hypothetical protein